MVEEIIDSIGMLKFAMHTHRHENCKISSRSIYLQDKIQQVKIKYYQGQTDYYMTYTLDGPFLLVSANYSHRTEFNEEAYEDSMIVCSIEEHSQSIFELLKTAERGTTTGEIYQYASGLLVDGSTLNNLFDYQPGDFPAADEIKYLNFLGWEPGGDYIRDNIRRSQEQGSWFIDRNVPERISKAYLKPGILEETEGGICLSKKTIQLIAYRLKH